MKSNTKTLVVLASLLILALPIINLASAADSSQTTFATNVAPQRVRLADRVGLASVTTAAGVTRVSGEQLEVSTDIPIEVDDLLKRLPKDFETVEAEVRPLRNRFVMWTRDLKHVMWGHYGNGFFIGTDNHGKRAWGIYRRGLFAGFYDGKLFYGKYRQGCWKARGLFGEPTSFGRYVVSPTPVATVIEAIP
jgi:hypothetical protein